MTASLHENEVLKACRTLFGPDVWLDRHFLGYLQPDGAKAAYRKRAKETHPDRFPGEHQTQKRQAEHFHAVHHAYDLVRSFLAHRDRADLKSAAGKTSRPREEARPHAHPHREKPARSSSGPIPSRTYEIGSYLYAVGAIGYHTLIEALVWQRRQRPPMGETARRWGWLDEPTIRRIMMHRSRHGRRFGEKAVELGLLTPFQVRTLLFHQRSRHQKLGQFFVQQGHLNAEELEALVRQMHSHNARAHSHADPHRSAS